MSKDGWCWVALVDGEAIGAQAAATDGGSTLTDTTRT